MAYNIGRPAKRARIQDLLCSVPEQQPQSARAITPFVQYQDRASVAIAWPNEQTTIPSSVSNARHQATCGISSQLTISAFQHIGRDGGHLENILEGRPDLNKCQDYRPAQGSLEAEAPCFPPQPFWQSSTSFNGYGHIPQQYAPQFGPGPLQPMWNEGHGTLSHPEPAHFDACRTLNPDLIQQPNAPQVKDEKVCFGMSSTVAAGVSVKFESSEQFRSLDHEAISGRLHSRHSQMIYGLLQEDTLELFVSCSTYEKLTTLKQARGSRVLPCTLEVTIYGPIELLEEIGDWFQEQDIYLQDPRSCHLDVKYCNPHKLSTGNLEACPLLSEVTAMKTPSVGMQMISSRPSFLDVLKSRDNLYEAHQPTAIRSTLKRHQKQALTFMLQRERGCAFDQEYIDLWEAHKTDHGVYFINRVADVYQDEEPAEFRGGIIADTMGLGKTLTMIALVATDLDASAEHRTQVGGQHQVIPRVDTTLIIIPPPCTHVFQDCLKWCRHHDKNRIDSSKELSSQNIVLTTYHTVSAEWKAYKNDQISLLFSVEWKRVILDEAHFIRNSSATMARAVCALSASSRWAVSGTPVQNRLADLASLLKFIQAHPYSDIKRFETDISSLWKSGKDEEAIKKLQYLSACLILRRAKGTINLPPKKDLLCPVEFLPVERESYEILKEKAILSIDEAISGQHGSSRPGVYANALQRIESLRLFSDLGLQYHARHEIQSDNNWSRIAQQAFNSKRGIEPLFCMQCSLSLDFPELLLDEPDSGTPDPQFSSCMKFICSDCIRKLKRDNLAVGCGHKPACPMASVSTGRDVFEETLDTTLSVPSLSPRLSSKVEALITDLKSLPKETKCVVFSTWRLTLDLVKAGLDQSSIESIRFDGKVPQNERGPVVDRFRTDPKIRVMLLTLSCGAVGKAFTSVETEGDLTLKLRNPTLEEQALARIHRLGQTKEVTTVRLFMRDSFEEEVMKVQDVKKQLANVLLSSHDGGSPTDNMGTLQGRIDNGYKHHH
ncbi:hypothetical protein GGS24DRAFT_510180 [Hypoxylon argillaceum]|nr:hypothetical protein GGS24DRAFT_510180 [Hypoxylon argillaceum]